MFSIEELQAMGITNPTDRTKGFLDENNLYIPPTEETPVEKRVIGGEEGDEGLFSISDLEEMYPNQGEGEEQAYFDEFGVFEKSGLWFRNTLLGIGTKAVGGVSSVLEGLGREAIDLLFLDGDQQSFWDTASGRYFDELEKDWSTSLHSRQIPGMPEEEEDFMDRVSSPDFWFNEFGDGIEFLVSALIGAKGAGAASKLAGVGRGISKFGTSTLSKLGASADFSAKFGKAAGSLGQLGIETNAMTAFESSFEARHLQDDVEEKLYKKYILEGMSEEEAMMRSKSEAKAAAGEAFKNNMQLLNVTNAMELTMLGRGLKGLGRGLGATTRTIGQIGQETIEEGGQWGIGHYLEEKYLEGKDMSGPGLVNAFNAVLGNIDSDVDLQTSMFLGGLLGGGMSAITEGYEYYDYGRAYKKISSELDKQGALNYIGKKLVEYDADGKLTSDSVNHTVGKWRDIVNNRDLKVWAEQMNKPYLAEYADMDAMAMSAFEALAASKETPDRIRQVVRDIVKKGTKSHTSAFLDYNGNPIDANETVSKKMEHLERALNTYEFLMSTDSTFRQAIENKDLSAARQVFDSLLAKRFIKDKIDHIRSMGDVTAWEKIDTLLEQDQKIRAFKQADLEWTTKDVDLKKRIETLEKKAERAEVVDENEVNKIKEQLQNSINQEKGAVESEFPLDEESTKESEEKVKRYEEVLREIEEAGNKRSELKEVDTEGLPGNIVDMIASLTKEEETENIEDLRRQFEEHQATKPERPEELSEKDLDPIVERELKKFIEELDQTGRALDVKKLSIDEIIKKYGIEREEDRIRKQKERLDILKSIIDNDSGQEVLDLIDNEIKDQIREYIGEFANQENPEDSPELRSSEVREKLDREDIESKTTGGVSKSWVLNHIDRDILEKIGDKLKNEKDDLVRNILERLKSKEIEVGGILTSFEEIFNSLEEDSQTEIKRLIEKTLKENIDEYEAHILKNYNLKSVGLRIRDLNIRLEELNTALEGIGGEKRKSNLEIMDQLEEERLRKISDIETNLEAIDDLKKALDEMGIPEKKAREHINNEIKNLNDKIDDAKKVIRDLEKEKKRRAPKTINVNGKEIEIDKEDLKAKGEYPDAITFAEAEALIEEKGNNWRLPTKNELDEMRRLDMLKDEQLYLSKDKKTFKASRKEFSKTVTSETPGFYAVRLVRDHSEEAKSEEEAEPTLDDEIKKAQDNLKELKASKKRYEILLGRLNRIVGSLKSKVKELKKEREVSGIYEKIYREVLSQFEAKEGESRNSVRYKEAIEKIIEEKKKNRTILNKTIKEYNRVIRTIGKIINGLKGFINNVFEQFTGIKKIDISKYENKSLEKILEDLKDAKDIVRVIAALENLSDFVGTINLEKFPIRKKEDIEELEKRKAKLESKEELTEAEKADLEDIKFRIDVSNILREILSADTDPSTTERSVSQRIRAHLNLTRPLRVYRKLINTNFRELSKKLDDYISKRDEAKEDLRKIDIEIKALEELLGEDFQEYTEEERRTMSEEEFEIIGNMNDIELKMSEAKEERKAIQDRINQLENKEKGKDFSKEINKWVAENREKIDRNGGIDNLYVKYNGIPHKVTLIKDTSADPSEGEKYYSITLTPIDKPVGSDHDITNVNPSSLVDIYHHALITFLKDNEGGKLIIKTASLSKDENLENKSWDDVKEEVEEYIESKITDPDFSEITDPDAREDALNKYLAEKEKKKEDSEDNKDGPINKLLKQMESIHGYTTGKSESESFDKLGITAENAASLLEDNEENIETQKAAQKFFENYHGVGKKKKSKEDEVTVESVISKFVYEMRDVVSINPLQIAGMDLHDRNQRQYGDTSGTVKNRLSGRIDDIDVDRISEIAKVADDAFLRFLSLLKNKTLGKSEGEVRKFTKSLKLSYEEDFDMLLMMKARKKETKEEDLKELTEIYKEYKDAKGDKDKKKAAINKFIEKVGVGNIPIKITAEYEGEEYSYLYLRDESSINDKGTPGTGIMKDRDIETFKRRIKEFSDELNKIKSDDKNIETAKKGLKDISEKFESLDIDSYKERNETAVREANEIVQGLFELAKNTQDNNYLSEAIKDFTDDYVISFPGKDSWMLATSINDYKAAINEVKRQLLENDVTITADGITSGVLDTKGPRDEYGFVSYEDFLIQEAAQKKHEDSYEGDEKAPTADTLEGAKIHIVQTKGKVASGRKRGEEATIDEEAVAKWPNGTPVLKIRNHNGKYIYSPLMGRELNEKEKNIARFIIEKAVRGTEKPWEAKIDKDALEKEGLFLEGEDVSKLTYFDLVELFFGSVNINNGTIEIGSKRYQVSKSTDTPETTEETTEETTDEDIETSGNEVPSLGEVKKLFDFVFEELKDKEYRPSDIGDLVIFKNEEVLGKGIFYPLLKKFLGEVEKEAKENKRLGTQTYRHFKMILLMLPRLGWLFEERSQEEKDNFYNKILDNLEKENSDFKGYFEKLKSFLEESIQYTNEEAYIDFQVNLNQGITEADEKVEDYYPYERSKKETLNTFKNAFYPPSKKTTKKDSKDKKGKGILVWKGTKGKWENRWFYKVNENGKWVRKPFSSKGYTQETTVEKLKEEYKNRKIKFPIEKNAILLGRFASSSTKKSGEEKSKKKSSKKTLPDIETFLEGVKFGVSIFQINREDEPFVAYKGKDKTEDIDITNMSIKVVSNDGTETILKDKGDSYNKFVKRNSKYTISTLRVFSPKLSIKLEGIDIDPTKRGPDSNVQEAEDEALNEFFGEQKGEEQERVQEELTEKYDKEEEKPSAAQLGRIKEIPDSVIQEDLEWLQKVLPQIPFTETTLRQITDNIYSLASFVTSAEILDDFGKTYGIRYSKYTKKDSERSQIRHEAFEAIWGLFLNNTEKNRYLKAARKKYGEPTKADLKFTKKTYPEIESEKELADIWYKEQMADDFNEYKRIGYEGGYLRKLFDKILSLINYLLANPKTITDLFNRIENRGFANMSVNSSAVNNISTKHSSADLGDDFILEPAEINNIASSIVGSIFNMALNAPKNPESPYAKHRILKLEDIVSSFVDKVRFAPENMLATYLYSAYKNRGGRITENDKNRIKKIASSIKNNTELGKEITRKTIQIFNSTIGEKVVDPDKSIDELEEDNLTEESSDGKYNYASYELNFKDNHTPLVKLILSSVPRLTADNSEIFDNERGGGTITYLPMETATNLVVESIADFYEGEQTLDDWIKRLGYLSRYRKDAKFFKNTMEVLRKDNENLVNQFFAAFTLQKMNFINVLSTDGERRIQNTANQKTNEYANKWANKILRTYVSYNQKTKRFEKTNTDDLEKFKEELEKLFNKAKTERLQGLPETGEVDSQWLLFFLQGLKESFKRFDIDFHQNVLSYTLDKLFAKVENSPTNADMINFINGLKYFFEDENTGIFPVIEKIHAGTYDGLEKIESKKKEEEKEKKGQKKFTPYITYRVNEKSMNMLARGQALFDPNLIENTVFSIDGLKYLFSQVSFLNNKLNRLTSRNERGEAERAMELRGKNFHRRSIMLRAIIEDDFKPEIIDLDVLVNLDKDRRVSLTQPFLEEDLIANATVLLRPDGTKSSTHYSRLVSFNSHRRNNIAISLPRIQRESRVNSNLYDPGYSEENGIGNPMVIDVFTGYFLDEYERMIDNNVDYDRFKNYKNNRKKSYLFPNLSLELDEEQIKNLTSEEKELREILFNSNILLSEEVDELMGNEKLRDYIKSKLDSLIRAKKSYFEEMFTDDNYKSDLSILFGKNNKDQNIDNSVAKLVINGMIGNIETFKLFLGDWAFYKNAIDVTKRTHGITSSGYVIDMGKLNYVVKKTKENISPTHNKNLREDGKTSLQVMEDIIRDIYKKRSEKSPEEIESLAKIMEKDLEDADDIISNFYNEVDTTDASASMTLPYFRELMRKVGRWNDREHNEIYDELMKGTYDSSTAKKKLLGLLTSLQPLKTVQFDLNYDINENLAIATYHKWALQILHPASIGSTTLQKEYNLMVYGREEVNYEEDSYEDIPFENQIHFILYDSASKADHDSSNSVEKLTPENIRSAKMTINGWSMKIQQDLTAKYWKSPKVIEPTQFRKNVFQNMSMTEDYKLPDGTVKTGAELWYEINKLDTRITNSKLEEFKEKIEYNSQTRSVNEEKLFELLKDEILRKDMPDDIINALEAKGIDIDKIGIDKLPQYRDLLNSIISSYIRKKIIQTKLPGLAAIQIQGRDLLDSISIEDLNKDDISSHIKGDKIILLNNFKVDSEGQLKGPYMEQGKSGERKFRPGLVFLPYHVLDLMDKKDRNNPKKVREFLSDTKNLNVILARIPNQGSSSMDSAQIAGILPRYMGDKIITYSDITAKYGSDYDIDKMYVLMYNLHIKNKKLSQVKYYESVTGLREEDQWNAYKAYLQDNIAKEEFKYVKFLSKDIIDAIRELRPETGDAELDALLENIEDKYNEESQNYENINSEVRRTSSALWRSFGKYLELLQSKSYFEEAKEIMDSNDIRGMEKVERYLLAIFEARGDLGPSNTGDIETLDEMEKTLKYILYLSGMKKDAIDKIRDIKKDKRRLIDAIEKDDLLLVAKTNGLKSFNGFISSFNPFEHNSMKAVENRKIDIYRSIIESEWFHISNITPLDKFTKILKGFLRGDREDKNTKKPTRLLSEDLYEQGLDLFTLSSQLHIKNINMVAKSAISLAANSGVNLTLSQMAEIRYMLDLGTGHNYIDIAKNRNEELEFLSSIISGALLNAFVDAEKDPWISFANIMTFTYPVVDLLIKTGVSTDKIMSFMMQPFVAEIIKNRKYFSPEFESPVKELKGIRFILDEVQITADKMGKFEEFHIAWDTKDEKTLFQKWIVGKENDRLQDNLENVFMYNEEDGLSDTDKIELLVLFDKLLFHGDIMSKAILATKFDVNGGGKNFEQADKKLYAIQEILGLDSEKFIGLQRDGSIAADSWVGKIINETMTDNNIIEFEANSRLKNFTKIFLIKDSQSGKYELSSMGAYFKNSIVLLQNFMKNNSIVQDPEFKKTVKSVATSLGDPYMKNERAVRKIKNALFAHLLGVQFFSKDGIEIEGEDVIFSNKKMKALLFGDTGVNSAYESLERIKNKAPNFYQNMSAAVTDIKDEDKKESKGFLYSNNFENKSTNLLNVVHKEIRNLYEDPRYKEDIQNLIYYALFSSGFTFTTDSFINMLPYDVVSKAIDTSRIKERGVNTQGFMEELVQNKYLDADLVPAINKQAFKPKDSKAFKAQKEKDWEEGDVVFDNIDLRIVNGLNKNGNLTFYPYISATVAPFKFAPFKLKKIIFNKDGSIKNIIYREIGKKGDRTRVRRRDIEFYEWGNTGDSVFNPKVEDVIFEGGGVYTSFEFATTPFKPFNRREDQKKLMSDVVDFSKIVEHKISVGLGGVIPKEGATNFNSLPSRSDTPTMTYAGIGSRQTNRAILDQMTEVAKELKNKGFILNTGALWKNPDTKLPNEEGADKAFSDGAGTQKNLFTPDVQGKREKELAIAKEIHTHWDKLKPGGKNLQARNTNQIFGDNLDTPVDFVLFAAPETDDLLRPKGGTGQAVEMARRKGIPTINMENADWRSQLEDVLNTLNIPQQPTTQPQGVLSETDKIIWAHPALGKTTYRNANPNTVLDFDTDFKPEVAKRLGLPKNKQNSISLNTWRSESSENDKKFKEVMREVWGESKKEAKSSGKMLLVSDMMFLRENKKDFDRVISTSKETFTKRTIERGDDPTTLDSWKTNLDALIETVDKNKVAFTDKYFSELIQPSTQPQGLDEELGKDDCAQF